MIRLLLLLSMLFQTGCYAQYEKENIRNTSKAIINSKVLDDQRELFINLPANYSHNTEHYPVLYLLDGEFMPILHEAIAASEYLHYFNETSEFIIVGISTSKDRDKYFIPENNPEDDQENVNKLKNFLLNEVIPFIESGYRTTDYKILFGASNGGLFSLYTLLTTPDMFHGIIASSPTIGHCPDLINKLVNEFVKKDLVNYPKIYLNFGESDTPRTMNYTPDFYNKLKKLLPTDYPILLKVKQDQGHVPFGSIFEGLNFIFNAGE